MVFYAAFNSISVISRRQLTLFMSFLGFTSTRLGSEVSLPRTVPRKNPEDLVLLEPTTLDCKSRPSMKSIDPIQPALTWPETFRYCLIFNMCKDESTSSLSQLFKKGRFRIHEYVMACLAQ